MRFTVGDLEQMLEALRDFEHLKAEIADFLGPDGLAEFLEVPTGDAFDVKPDEAIRYFQGKGLRVTGSYADMKGDAHDQAFTVAKMMDVDMLGQVRASLDKAMSEGKSFREWAAELRPTLERGGWTAEQGGPGSAWRLETIFRTNMQTAYAAGQWQQIQEQAAIAPFLLYDAVDDFRTRQQHRRWDRTVLPVTHEWWKTHYPPNGYNCRCSVIQLDAAQLASMGISPSAEPPQDGTYRWRNPRTGERHDIPDGVDPGFSRNPGANFQADTRRVLNEKIDALPVDMQPPAKKGARIPFDETTDLGRWHRAGFDKAPDWLRDAVVTGPNPAVTYEGSGAWARRDKVVNMAKYRQTDGERAVSVWRHEYGHVLDANMGADTPGGFKFYRSSGADWDAARGADAAEMLNAAAVGRKSKALERRIAERTQAYEDARERIVDAASGDDGIEPRRAARARELEKIATKAGVDLEQFVEVIRSSTLILEAGAEVGDLGVSARLAKALVAVERGDVQTFLEAVSFKDVPTDYMTTSRSWRKDGALASLSDLAGAATKNRVAGHQNGFPGHSDAYYARQAENQNTEAFANLTALAGHPVAYWWELAKRFAPAMSALFEQLITERTAP